MNETITVTIDGLGHSGEGVGRCHGLTTFIDGALPGETVEAELIVSKKSYTKGNLLRILSPSKERVSPPCPYFGKCGGCQLMHLSETGQLENKRQRVQDALKRIGKIDAEVLPTIASPKPLHYRNKIQLVMSPNGPGFYRKGSHDVISVDHCLIHCELGEKVFQELQKHSFTPYDENTGQGEIRHILIKSALHTKKVLITFVSNIDATEELKNTANQILKSCPEVAGIVHNRNSRRDNVILGKEYSLLAGKSEIIEKLNNLEFSISSASFFQVNTLQAEAMYQKVIEFSKINPNHRVIDAYCGVGSISLQFARLCKEVIGIESVPEAIQDARANAKRNQIKNCSFICGKVEETIGSIDPADLVVLNPPRKGCEPSVLQAIAKMRPNRVIYVSCDPATLARDLKILAELGYCVQEVQPFDMFPQTSHVETVALLKHNES